MFCLFCFDYFIESWFHCSRLCVASNLFLVLVFVWVISENPASHKYVEENEEEFSLLFRKARNTRP